MANSFDKTVIRLCKKKLESPDAPLLGDTFTVTEMVAEALIKKACAGTGDSIKILREILSDNNEIKKSFNIDINVVD